MSDGRDLRIEPTPGVRAPAPVQAVHHQSPVVAPLDRKSAPQGQRTSPAATTGGSLRASYAQFSVNADTHDVVISIRDAATDQVISETPSREFEAMSKSLADYANNVGRHRAAATSNSY